MNLATYLRSRGRHEQAIARYEQARALEPRYERRAHYFYEYAGSLFLLRRFNEAAAAYGRAIELGSDQPDAVALHADALLYAGKYRRAHEGFQDYVTSSAAASDDGEYRLKACALDRLRDRLGLDEQARDTERALGVAGGRDPVDARGGRITRSSSSASTRCGAVPG